MHQRRDSYQWPSEQRRHQTKFERIRKYEALQWQHLQDTRLKNMRPRKRNGRRWEKQLFRLMCTFVRMLRTLVQMLRTFSAPCRFYNLVLLISLVIYSARNLFLGIVYGPYRQRDCTNNSMIVPSPEQ